MEPAAFFAKLFIMSKRKLTKLKIDLAVKVSNKISPDIPVLGQPLQLLWHKWTNQTLHLFTGKINWQRPFLGACDEGKAKKLANL